MAAMATAPWPSRCCRPSSTTSTAGAPAKKGEAANDQLLTKAIEGYKTAAEKSADPKLKKLSLEYLVAAYRDDVLPQFERVAA